MRIVTCEHCRLLVAVGSDAVCPSCRQPTRDVPLPAAVERKRVTTREPRPVPDTWANSAWRNTSYACAGLQVASLVRHAATHHEPRGVYVVDFSPFLENVLTVFLAILLLVLGSAAALGAGRQAVWCAGLNWVLFVLCCLLVLVV